MNGLRPRQVKAIDDIRAAYAAGYRAPVLVAPTGFGKTHTTAELVRISVAKGKRVWFMAHLREILEATSGKLTAEGIRHGTIMAGQPEQPRLPVQVVSVQTAVRRLDRLPRPDLLIIDEAHLAVAETYRKVIRGTGDPFLLLLTATPQRLDGRGLGEVADVIIPTCSSGDLIAEGLLAPIRYFAPTDVDLSGVRTLAGDYARDDLEAVMSKPKLVGDAVAHWLRLARHRPTIRFCCSIAHAEAMAHQFRSAGVRAVAVSGETDSEERRQALADLQAGRVDVVTNCALWVAGVDAPNVSCIGLDRPTKSLTMFLQSVGRGLRIHPGKPDCVVLDHGGLYQMHGHPAALREWTLEGNTERRGKGEAAPSAGRRCPVCFAISMPGAEKCVDCGNPFPVEARKIRQVEGDLEEIADVEAKDAAREQGMTKSLAGLIALGKMRGYQNPTAWAHMVWKSRKGRRRA